MSRRMSMDGIAAFAANAKPSGSVTALRPAEAVCGYCAVGLEDFSRVYRHEHTKHPVFCSHDCLRHYDARRVMELKTFGR